jgi:hypothetical protein
VLATANIPIDHSSTSIKRVGQSRNALTVELCENPALHTSVVSVARRHILKEPVKEILRQTTVVAAMALVALAPLRKNI